MAFLVVFSSSLLVFSLSGTQQRVREGNGDVGKGGFARRVLGGGQKEPWLRLLAPPPSELVRGWRASVSVAFLVGCCPQIPDMVWCGAKEGGFTVAHFGEGAVLTQWKAWRNDETAGHGVSHLQFGRRESEQEVGPSCKTSVAAPVTCSYPMSTSPPHPQKNK